MKKHLLILIIYFSIQGSFAQNYRTINPAITSHFISQFSFSPGRTYINSISIDSIYNAAGHDELFNLMSIDLYAGTGCYPASRSTWIGNKTIQDISGMDYIINVYDDSLYFQTQANLNDTWYFFKLGGGDYIEAKVISIAIENFIGLTDSVKTLSLQAKNSSGNNILNDFNSLQIKISKNYGFIKTYRFLNFPNDTTSYSISGISNPASGYQNLTAAGIFNFDVGDEFHYHNKNQPLLYEYFIDYYSHIVLSKNISANSDTITYTYDRIYFHEHFNNGYDTTYSGHDTLTDIIILSSKEYLNKLTVELLTDNFTVIQPDNGYSYSFYDTNYFSRNRKFVENFYVYDSTNNCFTTPIGFGVFPSDIFADGLGKIYGTDYSYGQFMFERYDSLVYYKKGAEEWGQKLNWSQILGINKNSTIDEKIKIYPNPVNDFINVSFSGAKKGNVEVSIHNSLGNLLFKKKYSSPEPEIQIPFRSFYNGVYLLTVLVNDTLYNFKIVK